MDNTGPERSRRSTNRLFIHDIQILDYHLRSLFSSPRDGLTAVAGAVVMVAFARYSIFSLEPLYRQIVVAVVATALAPYIYHFLAQRVAFFRSDSVLADLALDAAIARRYFFSIAFILGLAIIAVLLVPASSLMLNFFLSFCGSLLITVLVSKVFVAFRLRIAYQKQERLDRLVASRYRGGGLSVAAVGGGATVFAAARLVEVDIAATIATLTSAALYLWYAPIAYSAIEYERLIGWSPVHTLRSKLRNLVFLGGALTVLASLSLKWQVVAAVVAVFAVLLLYKGLEVLVVRAVGGSRAQISLIVILFGLAGIGIIVPFLIPALLLVCVWRLLAIGGKRTWQLA